MEVYLIQKAQRPCKQVYENSVLQKSCKSLSNLFDLHELLNKMALLFTQHKNMYHFIGHVNV